MTTYAASSTDSIGFGGPIGVVLMRLAQLGRSLAQTRARTAVIPAVPVMTMDTWIDDAEFQAGLPSQWGERPGSWRSGF